MSSYQVDRQHPVLVTGGTGYVAGVLIEHLLQQGLTVHTTVRDPSQKERYDYLLKLSTSTKSQGTIKIFSGDLMEEGSFAEAMKGCTVVFHTASPFQMQAVQDPQRELVDPAVKGTRNVLRTATATPTVKRVILTSSIGAVACDAADAQDAPEGVLNEDVWNTQASIKYQPYFFSKTQAEKAAWIEAGSQTQWKLVVINPGLVLGPGVKYHENSESFRVMKQFVDGSMKSGVPRFAIAVVDVRDVAEAHIAAAFLPDARGRHVLVGHNSNFLELGQTLAQSSKFHDLPLPSTHVPWWIVYLISPYTPNPFPRKVIYRNVDVESKYDSSKAKNELGVHFRSLLDTLQDHAMQLADAGIIPDDNVVAAD